MKSSLTHEQINKIKNRDYVPVFCTYCDNYFLKRKKDLRCYNYPAKYTLDSTNVFCSRACESSYTTKSHNVVCLNCNKNFTKTNANYIKSPNHFCCKSCSATYNNTHKMHGTRRSKLEQYLETQIIKNYPNLNFICNTKDVIKSELDFYFPDFKLAIEINGIFHYKSIYGEEKFLQIQNNDKNKLLACQENNIKLFIINTSKDGYLNQKTKDKYWLIISNILKIFIP